MGNLSTGTSLPSAPARLGPRRRLTPADVDNDAFWSEFMKRPDARSAYAAQKRLQEKKRQWLEERQKIEERGEHRRRVAAALKEAPAEIKKLIAPIFHIRIVEDYLWQVLSQECHEEPAAFVDALRKNEKVKSELLNFRENFQAGGEGRMEDMERHMLAINKSIADEAARKIEVVPQKADIQTLKQLLEYAQQCKLEGNAKYREGLYEEALAIYSQADEAMKHWKVDGAMKNEKKWLTDSHLACLKNKSQAALSLELFQTALDAANAALELDVEDHKAWYRKLQAEKGLGKIKEAEESLLRLEDVAQWCPDRRNILKDCEAERKRLKVAKLKNKMNTQEMLGKAFEAGIFSIDRERELEEASRMLEAPPKAAATPKITGGAASTKALPSKAKLKPIEEPPPIERRIQLTAKLAGELLDQLAEAYSQKWFQERVRKCARDSGFERSVFLMRLKDVAFKVQKPVLERWGFEGTEQGVREMTASIRDHAASAANGGELPTELREKQDRCLRLLYGGEEGGMLDILTQ